MLISDRPRLVAIPPQWEQPIREFEIYLRAHGRTTRTIDTRVRHLRTMARYLVRPPEEVTPTDLTTWSGTQTWQPETRNAYHSSARLFFRWWAHATGHDDPATHLRPIRRPVPPPRPAPDDAIATAIATSEPRTRLILILAARLGLRANEIAELHTRDIESTDTGWASLTVHGKGRTERLLPVPPEVMEAIQAQQPAEGWVFPGFSNGHLSSKFISKLANWALPGKWTLHTLRHRFATVAYNNGGRDLLAVQKALGHESITTTQRYTQTALDLQSLITTTKL